MSITMNLYYTGKDGSARRFAEEMERSGTADQIRAEEGNERYDYFFSMNAHRQLERSGISRRASRVSDDGERGRASGEIRSSYAG